MVKNTKNMIETFFFFHSTYSFLLTILCSVNFSRFKFWISWKFASFQPIRKSLETAWSSGGVWSSSLSFVVVLNFMMFMYGDENKKDFAWKRISADIRPSERSDELRHGGVLAGAFVELSKTRKTYSPHRLLSTACSINYPDPNMRQVNSLWGLWAKHVNTSKFSMWPNHNLVNVIPWEYTVLTWPNWDHRILHLFHKNCLTAVSVLLHLTAFCSKFDRDNHLILLQ